jgi:putative hemolysin
LYGILMAQLLEPWLRGFALGHVFVLVAQTSISTLIILVFAEFLPKVLFRIDPKSFAGLLCHTAAGAVTSCCGCP